MTLAVNGMLNPKSTGHPTMLAIFEELVRVSNSSGRRDVIGHSYEVNSSVFIAVTLPN